MKRYLQMLLAIALVLADLAPAFARMGGGQSYSGSSHSYSSHSSGYSSSGGYSSGGGGGSGGSDLIFFLIRLVFEYPLIGVPLLLIAGYIYFHVNQSPSFDSSTVASRNQAYGPSGPVEVPDMQSLQRKMMQVDDGDDGSAGKSLLDANFSRYLMYDFLCLLNSRIQNGRSQDLADVRAYLNPTLLESLVTATKRAGVESVTDVVVGSIVLQGVTGQGDRVNLSVVLETNYTEHSKAGEKAYYSKERWVLSRKKGLLSKGPEEITRFACPGCGQSGEIGSDGKCPYCERIVNRGDFGWLLDQIQVLECKNRPPVLTSDGDEQGTELPTMIHPTFARLRKEFEARHPQFTWKAFEDHVSTMFYALEKAWSDQNWSAARPYQTDNLFQSHRYWIEAYKRQGLVNKLENIQLEKIVPVNVPPDPFFEVITCRVFASMNDTTVDVKSGRVVSGNPKQPTRFSEYWTLIRRVGCTGRKAPGTGCPNCGAPLDNVNQAGVCEYCQSQITKGDFDWVLSLIEQDEAFKL